MVWVIVAAAIVVLGLGAWAGTGRLGSMPPVERDRPRPVIPAGPVDQAFLDDLRIPLARHGYQTAAVDEYLDQVVAGVPAESPAEVRFPVVRNGYDMQAADLVLDRLEHPPADEAGGDSTTN